MMEHHVSVYLNGGVIAHVQSTNGDGWPRDVKEFDANGFEIPLVRIDAVLEPTAAEIEKGSNGHPAPRPASVLFQKELRVVAGKISYRAGEGAGGAIGDRVPVEIPVEIPV